MKASAVWAEMLNNILSIYMFEVYETMAMLGTYDHDIFHS